MKMFVKKDLPYANLPSSSLNFTLLSIQCREKKDLKIGVLKMILTTVIIVVCHFLIKKSKKYSCFQCFPRPIIPYKYPKHSKGCFAGQIGRENLFSLQSNI